RSSIAPPPNVESLPGATPPTPAKLSDSDLARPTVVPASPAAFVASTSPSAAAVEKWPRQNSPLKVSHNTPRPVETAPQSTVVENRFTTIEEDERLQREGEGMPNRTATLIQ